MQFLNKKTQKYLQEKIPWDKSVPYTRQVGTKQLQVFLITDNRNFIWGNIYINTVQHLYVKIWDLLFVQIKF